MEFLSRGRIARARWLRVALLGWLSFAASCSAPETATEVLVVIDADPELRARLIGLEVRVYDEAGKADLGLQEFPLSRARAARPGATFPLSYSLLPKPGANERFRLLVTGYGPGRGEQPPVALVQSQHIGTFVKRQRSLLTVWLEDECQGELCGAETWGPSANTCGRNGCAKVVAEPPREAQSGPLGGHVRPSERDGGRARDGGPERDAGSTPKEDAGPNVEPPAQAACTTALDCQDLAAAVTPAGCAEAECAEGRCTLRALDEDGDGHGNSACKADERSLGDDCDDADPERFPGAWDGPPSAGQQPDRCDTVDNDCNGKPDDGVAGLKTCTCDPERDIDVPCSLRPDDSVISWPAGTPVGDCRYGKRSCSNGAWTPCTGAIEPAKMDSCEPVIGADADCDGKLNEDCPCTTGTVRPCEQPNIGECRAGEQVCVSGVWSKECSGAITPREADTCEPGNDANCDGVPNQGCSCVNGQTKTCADALRAKGECATKMVVCVDGKWPAASCAPTAVETCADDGKDENCNGQVNEQPYCQCTNGRSALCGSLERSLRGNCALGSRRCVNGAYAACDVTPAGRDLCIFLDDSTCNGRANEGCECVIGTSQACGPAGCNGTQSCSFGGRWSACSYECPAPPPSPVVPAAP